MQAFLLERLTCEEIERIKKGGYKTRPCNYEKGRSYLAAFSNFNDAEFMQ